ncbi:DUF6639 family protein [Zeimonas arvi]|uniref:Uncharacterized protein n=1 Tax=Zeimonas arvi TaxID=2498847 RepID=A0A5C8P1B8_9BURK|nr:DUF6639 family protein [Zeimonas arvi]TXL67057.1 hypothetical protein FHP08_05415 [Zeimonas arvi]
MKLALQAPWFAGLLVAGALAASAESRIECAGTSVSARAPDRETAMHACEAAAAATRFLSGMGLDVSAPIELRIVAALPDGVGASAIGCFVREQRTAWVLIESECRNPAAVFELPMSKALHRSVVAHEIGHAIAGANFSVARPEPVAQEYIAYVTQLATMPPELRNRVLERYPRSSSEGPGHLNGPVYLMDPSRFAAIAWRHHLGPDGGAAFIRRVLDGRALADVW